MTGTDPFATLGKEKVTASSRCSKCGGMDTYMRYDSISDNLKVTCKRCEYIWRKEPLDKELAEVEV